MIVTKVRAPPFCFRRFKGLRHFTYLPPPLYIPDCFPTAYIVDSAMISEAAITNMAGVREKKKRKRGRKGKGEKKEKEKRRKGKRRKER